MFIYYSYAFIYSIGKRRYFWCFWCRFSVLGYIWAFSRLDFDTKGDTKNPDRHQTRAQGGTDGTEKPTLFHTLFHLFLAIYSPFLS